MMNVIARGAERLPHRASGLSPHQITKSIFGVGGRLAFQQDKAGVRVGLVLNGWKLEKDTRYGGASDDVSERRGTEKWAIRSAI